jgi:hypothetical protein
MSLLGSDGLVQLRYTHDLTAKNQDGFVSEINIHFCGLRNMDKPFVLASGRS